MPKGSKTDTTTTKTDSKDKADKPDPKVEPTPPADANAPTATDTPEANALSSDERAELEQLKAANAELNENVDLLKNRNEELTNLNMGLVDENTELRSRPDEPASETEAAPPEVKKKVWVKCRTTAPSYGPQYHGTDDIRRHWRAESIRFFPEDELHLHPYAIPYAQAIRKDAEEEASRERGEPATLSRLSRGTQGKSPVEAQAERARRFKEETGGKLPKAKEDVTTAHGGEPGAVPRVAKPEEREPTIRSTTTPVE